MAMQTIMKRAWPRLHESSPETARCSIHATLDNPFLDDNHKDRLLYLIMRGKIQLPIYPAEEIPWPFQMNGAIACWPTNTTRSLAVRCLSLSLSLSLSLGANLQTHPNCKFAFSN